MKVLVIFLVLIGFVGMSFAELEYVLTPFDIILSEDSFTTKGPNHNILMLEKNQSATINITIQNNDDKSHKITLKNPKPSLNLFDSFVFEPEQVIVPAHQQNSTDLYLKIAEDTNTHSSFTTFLAQSNTFGMKGIGFVIVVDREIDEFTDKSLRAGLPGSAFPKMNSQITENEAEKMIDNGFGTPKFLPKDYQFQGMTDWGQSQQFLYSPVSVDNSTESIAFWGGGGMMINYYNYSDNPNINNTKSLPVRIAQDEAQQIMINGMMGMAIEKQTRMVAYSDTEYDVPAEVEFFNDSTRSLVSLRANMQLDELLKVASSIPNYEGDHSSLSNPNDGIMDLTVNPPIKQFNSGIPFDEIQCNQNLVLIQKYDGSPACVKPETAPKLVTREWGISDNWIKISNTNSAIHYEIEGAKITSIQAFSEYTNRSLPGETQQTGLKINLESKQNGVLQITLPRNLIDSKIGNTDDGFFVLLGGTETEYNETKTESERILNITFPANTDMLEILGHGYYNSDLEQLDG